MTTTDKSERSTSTGDSIPTDHARTSALKLLRFSIVQAIEDAAKGKGKRQREAMTYLSSRDFADDCAKIGLSRKAIGDAIIRLLNMDEDDRIEEITKLKRFVRGA